MKIAIAALLFTAVSGVNVGGTEIPNFAEADANGDGKI